MIRIAGPVLIGVLVGLALSVAIYTNVALPVTVAEVRLSAGRDLARHLLGDYVGRRVIEVEKHEYDGTPRVPREVVFYTQPALSWPRENGICATDVITVEFDWPDVEEVDPLTVLKFQHIEAKSRFKSFPMPPGDPGSPENDRLQAAACAKFVTARDSFEAPSAGDAQWLAAMEREYSRASPAGPPFAFTCQDFADPTCAKARAVLPHLALQSAQPVEIIDCPRLKWRDQVNFCYRLTFPYAGTEDPDAGTEDPEWVLTLFGGMADGSAPVQIRAANLVHSRRPVVLSLGGSAV